MFLFYYWKPVSFLGFANQGLRNSLREQQINFTSLFKRECDETSQGRAALNYYSELQTALRLLS